MGKNLYLYIENDKYELPIAIADSPSELSEMIGVPKSTILSYMSRAKRNGEWCQYIKVPLEGDYKLAKIGDKKLPKMKLVCYSDTEYYEHRSIKEAAEMHKISVSSVKKYLKDGKGIGLKWARL